MSSKALFSILILSLSVAYLNLNAQNRNVGIGTSNPHPSAILQLGDNDSLGFSIPYTDTNAVIAYANSFTPPIPIANGLLIFQKGAETFYYYDAPLNKWIPLSGITGPTGSTGPTGPTGPTGEVAFGSKMKYGSGPPTPQPGDTCGYYYIDMVDARVYKFNCPGGWFPATVSYLSKIFGGETVTVHSTSNFDVSEPLLSQQTNWAPIPGLEYTVAAPPGFSAYAFVTAYGACRKINANNDYQYAKYDFFVGTPEVVQNNWQVVSLGPTGPSPDNHQDLVKWSISMALSLGSGKRILVYGGNSVKTKKSLGNIRIAGAPGTQEEAHMDIMVIYVRN